MRTDKNLGKKGPEGLPEGDEDNQEKSLQWLLDMDLSEPEDTLFKVEGNDYRDEGLTAYEAEVAARPLVRGNASGDDLASYVDEEIVISSDSVHNDIYAEDKAPEQEAVARRDEIMAIDYSLGRRPAERQVDASIDEGTDVLNLSADDDIGEQALSIRRVKAGAQQPDDSMPAPIAAVAEPEAPADAGAKQATPEVAADGNADDVTAVVAAGPEATDEEQDDALFAASLEDFDGLAEQIEGAGDMELAGEEEAGGDIEELSFDDMELPDMNNFVDAPVPTQVADPSIDLVANEGFLGDLAEFDAALEESVLTADGSIGQDAAASIDEAIFDDFDDLEFVTGEQAAAGDDGEPAAMACGMDSGEDTVAVADEQEVADIAPLLQEIAERARVRAESLGFGADAVAVEVVIGVDDVTIRQCYADGFEPVASICAELSEPLQHLHALERDLVYVRLVSTTDGCNWNDLFSEDFAAASTAREEFGIEDAEAIADPDSGFDIDVDGGFSAVDFGDLEQVDDDFGSEFAAAVDTAAVNTAGPEAAAAYSLVFDDESMNDDIEAAFASLDAPDDEDELPAFEAASESPVAEVEAAGPTGTPADEPAVEADEPAAAAARAGVAIPQAQGAGTGWCIPEGITFNYTTQSNAEIFADFLDAFIEEGSTEIEKLENIICEWEKDVTDENLFAEVGRTLHTIKGIAKGVGLQRFGTLVHNFETLLDGLARPAAGEDQMYFRVVNAWLDAVVRGIEFVTEERKDIASELPLQPGEAAQRSAQPAPAEAVAGTASESDSDSKPEAGSVPAQVAEPVQGGMNMQPRTGEEKKLDRELADEGAKALAAQQSVRITSEKLDRLLNLTGQAQQLGVRATQSTSRSKYSSAELQARLTSVRAHIGKIADRALLNVTARGNNATTELDALEMDQYSELQEAASILREGVEDLADLVELVNRQHAQIESLMKQQSSVISSISSAIQDARVVPVSRLMPGLRRIVRTVSNDLGKTVTFKVLNEIGALDRDHYARLQVVMEHMVRNALDHGIESEEERLAGGKPVGGRITVDVQKSGGDYIVRLSDDGRGIDPDAIRQSAIDKGLDIDVDALSDDEAMRLIFHKGFSTASKLSEISGRGVGMDIVLSELQAMGGDIQIKSTIGLGTSFIVRIPSNVSVNGALLVSAGEESYAIPLNGLIAVEQVPVDEFYAAIEQGRRLTLLEMDCKLAYLATLCQGVGLPERSTWDRFVPVILAGSGDKHMAIAIDNVAEALELVVRSLGSQFSSVPGVAGAATTSNGEAIVALDLNVLANSVTGDGLTPMAEGATGSKGLLALVVDDSRTQRMVATSQLDTVGVQSVTAENGQVALDLLAASQRLPDVVLLDVEMPVKDGIETLREIRKSSRFGHLPVIMVTSRTGAKHRALAKAAGCSAYMGKPFNFPALVEQINDLTGYELQIS